VIIEEGDDGYYVVQCPALPGCWSQGKTKEEALANIREAMELYVESLTAHVEPIPTV
jgi:predicted RNase H-like HicB family nuclease